jgi:lipoprotein-releasing system permease protein
MFNILKIFLNKYIFSNRKEWLRTDSVLMFLGIIISVATLTVAFAIFEGYENVLKKTILGVNSHIYVFLSSEGDLKAENEIELTEFLTRQDEVEAFAPVLITQAMAQNNDRIKGSIIRGIDWNEDNMTTNYRFFVQEGTPDLSDSEAAVIGYKLAAELNLKLGDSFTLISPLKSTYTPLGVKPNKKLFRIVGLYKSGMHEYDSKYIFVDRRSAADFTKMNNAFTMLEIKLKQDQIDRADYLAYKWSNLLDHRYQLSSWIFFNGNLFALLTLEKWIIYIILSFLILIASFNVISSVTTSILEKRQELGILKSYGASNNLLRKIFISKALMVSVAAIITGQILGMAISYFLSWQTFFLLKGDVYFLDKINVQFSIVSWLLVMFTALFIVFLSSLIPLNRINRIQVCDVLRGRL